MASKHPEPTSSSRPFGDVRKDRRHGTNTTTQLGRTSGMPGCRQTIAKESKQNHLSKPEDLMLQNATHLRKSAPGPPNSSDEHVSCTAPATRKISCQILCICPHLHLLSSDSFAFSGSSHLCFSICPYCRKFDF